MALAATSDTVRPATTRTYEVQRHTMGRWTVDSVADEKEVAIELAKALMNGRRPPSGVRVMAVELKESGKFSEISVYRSTMAEQGREEAPTSKPKIEVRPKGGHEIRDFKQTAKPSPAKKKSGLANLVRSLQIAVGLGLTLAAFEAMRLLMR